MFRWRNIFVAEQYSSNKFFRRVQSEKISITKKVNYGSLLAYTLVYEYTVNYGSLLACTLVYEYTVNYGSLLACPLVYEYTVN